MVTHRRTLRSSPGTFIKRTGSSGGAKAVFAAANRRAIQALNGQEQCSGPRLKAADQRTKIPATCQILDQRVLLAGSAVPMPLRINVGGAVYVDSLARTFEADHGFAGGVAADSAYSVTNTPDAALFRSYRHGARFSFSHVLATGNYAMWLEFADPDAMVAGERQMDVFAEGRAILTNYDIVADAGYHTAVAKGFDVKVTDGSIDLNFRGVVGDAIICAIVLIPEDVPQEAMPYRTNGGNEEARIVHSQSNLRGIYFAISEYTNVHRGAFPYDLSSAYIPGAWTQDTFASPRTSTLVPRGEQTDLEKIAWVAALNDYLYLGAGWRWATISNPATHALAYENPARVAGDINVLFADGHVECMTRLAAATLIGFSPADPSDPPPPWVSVTGDPAVLQSQMNLRRIETALVYYAGEHGGRYPDAPGDLYWYGVAPATFVNPRGVTPLPPPDLDDAASVAWINAGRDYLYLGAHAKAGTQAVETAMMYENPANMRGGINLTFADGRVEFRETRWAMETLARSGADVTPPTIVSTRINDGGAQRSMVNKVTVTFSEAVVVDAAGLRVIKSNGASIPRVTVTAANPSGDGKTWELTFSGIGAAGGSLPDGMYLLVASMTNITDLSGNHPASTYKARFHRLFGDADGDRDVDQVDVATFRRSLNPPGNYVWWLDYNGNGSVDYADYLQLRLRLRSCRTLI